MQSGPEGGWSLRCGLAKGKSLRLVWLALFAVGMAYVESAVVTYLRFLYYPDEFVVVAADAVGEMSLVALRIEVGREAATILMLVTVSLLAARRNWWERLAYFLWAFAVWDVFYYIWLFVLLRWPPDLMTLDILFLIPRIWVAPVVLPIAVSGIMMVVAATILRRT